MGGQESAQHKLRSKNGTNFLISREAVRHSRVLEKMYIDLDVDLEMTSQATSIPIDVADAETLKKIIEWCEYHKTDIKPPSLNKEEEEEEEEEEESNVAWGEPKKIELSDWDREFLNVDRTTLLNIIMVANYLDIEKLLDMCCYRLSTLLLGKTPEEIRQEFHVPDDLSEAEKESIDRENNWILDEHTGDKLKPE